MSKSIIEQKLKKVIGKQVSIKMELEKFFPDMVGEGELSLENFERLLKKYEENCVEVGICQNKFSQQKALKEFNRQVEAKIEEVSNKFKDDNKAYDYNAGLMRAQVIVEKCFGMRK